MVIIILASKSDYPCFATSLRGNTVHMQFLKSIVMCVVYAGEWNTLIDQHSSSNCLSDECHMHFGHFSLRDNAETFDVLP